MSFDLTDLRLFLHVVESGSITSGAERSYLALASASARIRNMEDALGVPLLTRGRRGVAPTEAGQALIRHAQSIMQEWERMVGDVSEYGQGLKGHIRLLCNTATITEYLPEVLSTYLNAHPNVGIDVQERVSAEIVQSLLDDKADVGVVARNSDVGDLATFPFRTLQLVLVVSPKHPLAARRAVSFVDTLDYEFVGLGEGSSIQKYLEAHASRAGKRINYRVRLRGFMAASRLVENNVGIAVIPESAALRCKKTMNLRVVRLADDWATRQLMLCVRDFDRQPLHIREFIEHIREPATPQEP
ncbi:MAG: LysR family transcriptional regulator [Humidesulfovibrio sp.]|uniref:LysR family transcriptional regulator n=1 Tax=Humidesulfovibrio sp. TaxID=2910988 RepID=UPI0027ECA344|nr:LysR family transcriptional regulator [Humidesulfovibrio sp.]MDQ7835119.1 LysR family transcriptional regulator [Humidesulfovibrio sp.]